MPIIKIPEVGNGVNLDLTPEELSAGVWSSATNMRFLNGYAQRFNGMAKIFDTPTATPYYLTAYQTPTKRYWVHAGTSAVFADDGTVRTEITPATAPTGGVDDRWSSTSFGGVLVMTNGVDVPYFWNGDTATDLAALTAWDTNDRCASIHTIKNYLVALDITKSGTRYPHMVKWSHNAVAGSLPSSWDETDVTKDCGENDLAETPDLIVDSLPMGDTLVIYKERSMYQMRFIGQPFIFQFTRLPGDSGMLFKGCGVDTPVGHVVLTSGDVVLHAGQGVKSIADGMVRKFIFDNLDSTNYKKAFVTSNPQRNEVLVCFPLTGSTTCDKAAVWNWETGKWGLRDLSNVTYGSTGQIDEISVSTWNTDAESWELDSSTWNQNPYSPNEARLLLAQTTRIAAFDVSGGDDGVNPLSGTLERTGLTFEDAYSNKMIRAVYPRIDSTSGAQVTIQVGGSMYSDKPPTWSSPVTFTVGQDIKADTFANGRFLSIRISCSKPWRMRSMDLDIVPSGAY